MLPPTSEFIELDGETVALLLVPPNWEDEVSVELTLDTETTPAISGRQTRRNFNRFARYSISYTGDILPYESQAESSTELRLWLNRLKGETVAVPLWADGVSFQAALAIGQADPPYFPRHPVRYGSTWVLTHDTIDSYEIVTLDSIDSNALHFVDGVTLPWPAGTRAYPLLFGRLTERPQWNAETDELFSGTISVKENSSFDRRIAPFLARSPRSAPASLLTPVTNSGPFTRITRACSTRPRPTFSTPFSGSSGKSNNTSTSNRPGALSSMATRSSAMRSPRSSGSLSIAKAPRKFSSSRRSAATCASSPISPRIQTRS